MWHGGVTVPQIIGDCEGSALWQAPTPHHPHTQGFREYQEAGRGKNDQVRGYDMLLHSSAPNSYGYLPRTCRRSKTQTFSMDGGKFWRPMPYWGANSWQLVAAGGGLILLWECGPWEVSRVPGDGPTPVHGWADLSENRGLWRRKRRGRRRRRRRNNNETGRWCGRWDFS